MRLLLPLLLAAVVCPAHADFSPPLGTQPVVAGPRTQWLTLGSTHLSEKSGQWRSEWLDPLRARLIAWRPQLITIENLSGAQCEMMRTRLAQYAKTYETYCEDATPYQRSLGLSQAEAEARAEAQLAGLPVAPTPAHRRQLAMLFLAAGEPGSASVQWLRLPPQERRAGDTLSADAVKRLTRASGRMNESIDIAAEVAASVGLERLYAVDDHSSDTAIAQDDPAFEAWAQARYAAAVLPPGWQRLMALDEAVRDGASLLTYYRAMNAPSAVEEINQLDFGGALSDPHPKAYGRQYAGWWDTRNLRMIANIRAASSRTPGIRVLNIVGSSHKPWYDQWASQMSDVEPVDAEAVLGR